MAPGACGQTKRINSICLQFGIRPEPEPFWIVQGLELEVRPGTITLLLGPSGAGKTAVLRALARRCRQAVDVGRTGMADGKAIADLVAPGASLGESLEILTACGVGEPRLWIRRYRELSDGERFRARLARAMGRVWRADGQGRGLLLCDEFGSVLHRRAAKAIAFNLRKLVWRSGVALVAACTHEDIAADLQPEVIVRLQGGGRFELERRQPRRRAISFARRLRIEPGRKADYGAFRPMHYRCGEELGFVDKVFVLREGAAGEPLGVVVYAHGPMQLSLRNRATGGRFVGNPERLNRELRILRRLVIHPDVRGCGLGHWLVRQTLPMVGVPYVECLANMGRINPVFEKAGMERIGLCPLPRDRQRAVAELRGLGVGPLDPDLAEQISRRPAVRRLVRAVVLGWLQATTGGGQRRLAHQTARGLAMTFRQLAGSRPVYYLWRR